MANMTRAASVLAVSSSFDRHDQIQTVFAFRDAVAALNAVSFTGILPHLPGLLRAGFSRPLPAQRRAGQANAQRLAVSPVLSGLVDFIRQHRLRVITELSAVVFHRCFQVAALVVIRPAGLLQIGVTVYPGQVKLLTKLRGIRTLPPLDRPHMGLCQTDDPVRRQSGDGSKPLKKSAGYSKTGRDMV